MERKESKISYFKSCRAKTPEVVNIKAALHWIKTGSSKALIQDIRQARDQPTKDHFKRNLPAVTFGGLFKDRSNLIEASGLACLDFDKVDNLMKLKEQLEASQYIYSFWVSPSGNGIKALVKIPKAECKEEYKQYYKAILSHFEDLHPDIATKDINRLCFESFDPDLYVNDAAQIFEEKVKEIINRSSNITNETNLPEGKVIDRILSWWVKKFQFANGNRNNSLFVLACALSNFGINKKTTQDLFTSFEDEDFRYNEIQKIINSAYNKADFNTETFPQ